MTTLFGNVYIVVEDDGNVRGTINMFDTNFNTIDSDNKDTYRIVWNTGNSLLGQKTSDDTSFSLGVINDDAHFVKDQAMFFTGHVLTRRVAWRPIRITKYRKFGNDFKLLVTSDFVESLNLGAEEETGEENEGNSNCEIKRKWLIPALHQINS